MNRKIQRIPSCLLDVSSTWLHAKTGWTAFPAELVTDEHPVLHKGCLYFSFFFFFGKMEAQRDLKMCKHCAVIKHLALSESHILQKSFRNIN